jgi:NADH-quinone oxidoreductase subunit G
VLSTWHLLLDGGRMQDGEPYLAGTAHVAVARVSPTTAAEIGLAAGGSLTVSTLAGSLTLPVVLTEMPQRVVWLPTNSGASRVRAVLGVDNGALVRIAPASTAATTGATGTGESA